MLGTIYSLVRRGIRLSNANHAQIRVILTAFSFELSRLLAYDPGKDDQKNTKLKNTQLVNKGIRDAMVTAVKLIQDNVKREEDDKKRREVKDVPQRSAAPQPELAGPAISEAIAKVGSAAVGNSTPN